MHDGRSKTHSVIHSCGLVLSLRDLSTPVLSLNHAGCVPVCEQRESARSGSRLSREGTMGFSWSASRTPRFTRVDTMSMGGEGSTPASSGLRA